MPRVITEFLSIGIPNGLYAGMRSGTAVMLTLIGIPEYARSAATS